MMITSWKSAFKTGFKMSTLAFLSVVVYMYILYFLSGCYCATNGNGPIISYKLYPFSLYITILISVIFAMLIPSILLKYSNAKYLAMYIPSSIIIYLLFYGVLMFTISRITWYITEINILTNPLVNWTSHIIFLLFFPIGSAIGTLIGIIINYVNHKKAIH